MFAKSLWNRFAMSVAVAAMVFGLIAGVTALSVRKAEAVAYWSYEDYLNSQEDSEEDGECIDVYEDEVPL